ncbi:hypothetical protein [Kitasatospora sp. NPDC093679]|uniref:hypothetical protein n=1 Tax=Kitasatospora sp. NPDC093679 TaxID=3154983 RepID=UPI00341972DE
MTMQQESETASPTGGKSPGALPQDETVMKLLNRSGRLTRTAPYRRTLLQQGKPGKTKPGPLAELVRRKQERALDLLLLVGAVTSGGDFSVIEWSTTWGRTVGLYDEGSATTSVSRSWKVLRDLRLISTARGSQGKTVVTKLLEDGSGAPYRPPGDGDPYFQLPFEYWEKGWYKKLSLPAKALLLITLSLRKPRFALPQERVKDWYGLSEATAGKGINELLKHNILVHVDDEWYDTLATRSGRASRPVYALWEPFAPRGLGIPVTDVEPSPTTTPGP